MGMYYFVAASAASADGPARSSIDKFSAVTQAAVSATTASAIKVLIFILVSLVNMVGPAGFEPTTT